MNNIVIDTENLIYKPKEIEFKIHKLVDKYNPILKKKLELFDFSNQNLNATQIASELVETCKKHNGLGLSSNQVGLEHRVCVVGYGDEYVAYFNPEVIYQSEEKTSLEEGCLSFPGLKLKISRPNSIKIKYQDYFGTVREKEFSGLTARILIHEIDHLNGVTFTELVPRVKLKIAQNKIK